MHNDQHNTGEYRWSNTNWNLYYYVIVSMLTNDYRYIYSYLFLNWKIISYNWICALTHPIIFESKPSIIRMINNESTNMKGHLSTAIVLWPCKQSKQVQLNSHKHKFTIQHFKLCYVHQEKFVQWIYISINSIVYL